LELEEKIKLIRGKNWINTQELTESTFLLAQESN
jgi:hypothetical protein